MVKIGKIGLVIIYDDHYDSYMATFYTTTCCFSEFVLRRNRLIRSGALVEESPILLLLRCLEASEW